MNTSIKQRVGCVLLSILLVIVFIGSILCALILPFLSSNGVAKADNGVVNSNLLLNGELSLPVSSFDDYIVTPDTAYAYITTNRSGDSVLYNNGLTVVSSSSRDGGMRYQVVRPSNGTYTVSFSCSSFPSQLRFWVRRATWSNYLSAKPLNSSSLVNGTTSVYSFTFTIEDSPTYIWLYFDFSGFSTSDFVQSSFVLDWLKLERGSSFTGYVPNYYENYGYNQGVLYGLDNSVSLQGYTRIGSRIDLGDGSVFTLDGRSYTHGTYTEDTRSLYGYNLPNYFVYDSLDGALDGTQIGFKFVSDLSFGNILITVPVADDYFTVVFEDTVTGDILYINKNDTLHWKPTGQNGVISGTWVSEWVNITFFSPNIQNIYFISNMFRSNNSAWNEHPFYFVGDTSLFSIYSTTSGTALTSFDEGFQEGVKQGRESAVSSNAQNVANARSAGYEMGRRDALADQNDYSFYGLLGSVFDAPIAAFRGLLNFEILGVNMQSFVVALLSLSVIIIIIKIALGGK